MSVNAVIGWLREKGHLVLLEGQSGYTVDGVYYDRSGLLALANRLRRERGLVDFPAGLARQTHRRRVKHRGSLTLLVGGGFTGGAHMSLR